MSVVHIKTAADIEKMRIAGSLAAQVLEMIESHVHIKGMTTEKLNDICHDFIVNTQKAIPAPLNYGGSKDRIPFPKSICTSLNNVVCHGIPDKRELKTGDILNIDVTVIKDGYHGDTSKMFLIGKCADHAKNLCKVTQECLYKGIEIIKPGAKLVDIGIAIENHAHKNNYSVVEDYCGHGIGKVFHEPPQVLHYNSKHCEPLEFLPGMIFTVEPMINLRKKETKLKKDGWTAVTKDRQLSAQWEHTILVTQDGVEILTLRDEEQIPFALSEYK